LIVGPVKVRSIIERYLGDKLSLRDFVRDLDAASHMLESQAKRVPSQLFSVLAEAKALLGNDGLSKRLAPSERVLKGVCEEALEKLPATDAVPILIDVMTALLAIASTIEQRDQLRIDGVVGSLARGEADAFSDVDIAATWIVRPKGFDYFVRLTRALQDLTSILARPVDVVFFEDMQPFQRERFTRDLVSIESNTHAA
jgi:predicted nucleotidyltransferase